MITKEDLAMLDEWTKKGDAPANVRAWHAQILTELVDYAHLLEGDLREARIKIADLDEQLRICQA